LIAPIANINEVSPFSICGTNPGGYLTAVTDPDYSYEWLRYGKLAPGQNTDSIYHVTKNGNYKLRVTNGQGCFTVSSKVVVKKSRLPKAVVSPSGTFSTCVGDSILLRAIVTRGTPPYLNYQWSRYNNLLIGQTADSIIVTYTGGYSVKVTDSKGCEDKSPRTVVNFVGCPRFDTNINSTSFEVTAYPNPFMDEVTLQLEEYSNENVRILIWDALGKEVVKMDEPPGYQYLINTSELISGIYFVEVYQGVNVKRLKLVKTE
jgi:hypothetical protein